MIFIYLHTLFIFYILQYHNLMDTKFLGSNMEVISDLWSGIPTETLRLILVDFEEISVSITVSCKSIDDVTGTNNYITDDWKQFYEDVQNQIYKAGSYVFDRHTLSVILLSASFILYNCFEMDGITTITRVHELDNGDTKGYMIDINMNSMIHKWINNELSARSIQITI